MVKNEKERKQSFASIMLTLPIVMTINCSLDIQIQTSRKERKLRIHLRHLNEIHHLKYRNQMNQKNKNSNQIRVKGKMSRLISSRVRANMTQLDMVLKEYTTRLI